MLWLFACVIEAEDPAGKETPCVESTWWADSDSDGYGNAAYAAEACDLPAGYAENGDDCDDHDAAVNPRGVEVCDGADNDCEGTIDIDATDATSWFRDQDADSLGDAGDSALACAAPEGYVAESGDCNDLNGAIGTGATYYTDADADGWGGAEVVACERPEDAVDLAGDCDDADPTAFPGAPEQCDDTDDDCDGDLDEDAIDPLTWYADHDADGYGTADDIETACDAPTGFVGEDTDCDDTSATIHPGAAETCSGLDEDCDGLVDADDPDMAGLASWYLDADADDHGDAGSTIESCERPDGYALDGDDCDDLDASVYPGADETCDGVDEDCDAVIDDNAIDWTMWYSDVDVDGYGDAGSSVESCDSPAGYVADAADCDDADATVSPDGMETCDGADQDCDGAVDEAIWYADHDGDTYGNAGSIDTTCLAPAGYVADATDCDDARADVSPVGAEVCDTSDTDEDCDGRTDDDDVATGQVDWYPDADGDGWGEDTPVAACDAPAGTVAIEGDCDDGDAGVSPDGVEVCGGADENCDELEGDDDPTVTGTTTWYGDADGDGVGGSTTTAEACAAPAGYSATADDCDDTDAAVSPAAYETCNDGIDQDCDGVDVTVCDADGDGYDVSVDCDETNPDINPGEREVCDAADTDEDCDGVADNDDSSASATTKTRYYADVDADGYGDGTGKLLCDRTAGYVANDEDCNDGDATVSPDAEDVCGNSVDDDCSGGVDDCTAYEVEDAVLTMTGSSTAVFGFAVAGGDFGGSAGRTLVVGAPQTDAGAGAVYLFDADDRGSVASGSAAAEITGNFGSGQQVGTDLLVDDTDGDGVDDLIIATAYTAYVVYGADVVSGGLLTDIQAAQAWGGYYNVFADVDGDGLADLVSVGSYGSTAAIGTALGPVLGAYSDTSLDCILEVDASDYVVVGADFDGDGADSVAAGGKSTLDGLYVFHDPCAAATLADSDVEVTPSDTSSPDLPGDLGAGDTDGDGYEELIVTRWYGSGSETAAWLIPAPAASGTIDALATATLVVDASSFNLTPIVAADLDGDGEAEVATLDAQSGMVYVLEDWSGAVDVSDLPYAGAGAVIDAGSRLAGVGDTDGDGTDDLLIGGYGSGSAWLWLGSDILP